MKLGVVKASFEMKVEQNFPNVSREYKKELTKRFKHEYQYFQNGTTITCISINSKYGFKAIGIAKCNPKDKFDLEKGMRISEIRCKSDYYKQLANLI